MKRYFWVAILAACLFSTGTAFAQSAGTTDDSAQTSTDTTTTDTTTTDTTPSVKQILKGQLTLMLAQGIHLLFQEIRPILGLPATPTDPTTDPLSILEAAIVSSITAASSSQ